MYHLPGKNQNDWRFSSVGSVCSVCTLGSIPRGTSDGAWLCPLGSNPRGTSDRAQLCPLGSIPRRTSDRARLCPLVTSIRGRRQESHQKSRVILVHMRLHQNLSRDGVGAGAGSMGTTCSLYLLSTVWWLFENKVTHNHL